MRTPCACGKSTILSAAAIPSAAALLCLLTPPHAIPQTPPSPTFEVASIKPDHSQTVGMSIGWRPGRFNAKNASTKMLLLNAFHIHDYQILDAPGWVNNDRYDVDATFDETQKLSPEEEQKQLGLRMQAMLVDRCKLKFHRTTKDLPLYELTLAKSGPKLQEAKPDEQFGMSNSDTYLKVTALTMPGLAEQLSAQFNRTVVDKTGLAGKYDFTLHYATDHDQPAPGYGQGAPQPDAGPPIFTALNDQLGLKLVASKGPVEMIVIDHIEPPSPN